jgi:hypothetical protein
MQTDDDNNTAYVEAAAKLLGIAIEPEWLPRVRAALAATNAATALVEEFPLDDDAEPAPVFKA